MSKQTTTDFRTTIGAILVKWHMPTRQAAISEIVSAVSELVEECIGEDLPYIPFETDIDIEVENDLRKEIRQRFKERGIEIK